MTVPADLTTRGATENLTRLAERAQESQAILRVEIREAHSQGLSLRTIAAATSLSHETVRRICSRG